MSLRIRVKNASPEGEDLLLDETAIAELIVYRMENERRNATIVHLLNEVLSNTMSTLDGLVDDMAGQLMPSMNKQRPLSLKNAKAQKDHEIQTVKRMAATITIEEHEGEVIPLRKVEAEGSDPMSEVLK